MCVASRLLQSRKLPFFSRQQSSTYIGNLASHSLRLLLPLLEIRTRAIQLRRINLLLVARPRPKQPSVGLELVPRDIGGGITESLGVPSSTVDVSVGLRGTIRRTV